MASPKAETILVPVAADIEPLRKQLAAMRVLCSQIGFALDTALLALDETAPRRVVTAEDTPSHSAHPGTES